MKKETISENGLYKNKEQTLDTHSSHEEAIEFFNTLASQQNSLDANLERMQNAAKEILKSKNLPIPDNISEDNWVRDNDGNYIKTKPEWIEHTIKNRCAHPDIANLENACFGTLLFHLKKENKFSPEYWAAKLLEHLYQLQQARDNNEINNAIDSAIKATDLYSKLEHRFKWEKPVISGVKHRNNGQKIWADRKIELEHRNDLIREKAAQLPLRLTKNSKALCIHKDDNFWEKNNFSKLSQRQIKNII